ncbi:MAG: pyridoxamine 5'-phosphate oxidase family protein [Candidatus Limnocylindrales bacterium]
MPASIDTLSPSVTRFLRASRRYAVIAHTDEEHAPHQAVVWYRLDDEGLLINSLVGRRWPRALQRDGRLAFTVHDEGQGGEREDYVTVEAEAVVVATGPAALADIEDLARRYGSDPSQFAGQQRISFRLRPRRVSVHGELV